MTARLKWLGFLLFALAWMLPWHVVVAVTLTLHDSTGKPLIGDAEASLQSADGTALGTVRLKDGLPSWSNNLHWWSKTAWPLTLAGGADPVQRARQATVKTQSCGSQAVQLEWTREYVPVSLAPHGGGAPYLYYHVEQKVWLDCVLP